MSEQPLIERLLALLFPDRCAGCGKLSSLFCPICQARLAPYPPDGRQPPQSLAAVHVAFTFQSPLREAVHQLKYHRTRRMARPLGALLAAHAAERCPRVDAVLSIPLHRERLAERGFNQAEALASEVARALRVPLLSAGIVRARATQQQAKLDARARAENMRDAFRWEGAPPPRRVLLVDDIYTTGATMGACAEALRSGGAEAVYGLALARSRLD